MWNTPVSDIIYTMVLFSKLNSRDHVILTFAGAIKFFSIFSYFKSEVETELEGIIPKSYLNIHNKNVNKTNISNNLSLNLGEHKYLSDIQLDNNIQWDSGNFEYETLGPLNKIDLIHKNLENLFSQLDKDQSYSILFIVKTGNNIKILDRQYLINYDSNISTIINFIYERIDLLTIKYNFAIDDILSCKYRPLFTKIKNMSQIKIDTKSTQVDFLPSKLYSGYYIPSTMDLSFYGVITKRFEDLNQILFEYKGKKLLVSLIQKDVLHRIDIFSPTNQEVIYTYIDEKFDNYFIRTLLSKNLKYPIYFKYDFSHNLLSMEYELKGTFMTNLKRKLVHDTKILTFDIETYVDENNNSIPYSCGFYDGQKSYSYYLTDFESSNAMLFKCLDDMMNPKYKGFTVYVHNFYGFDSIFFYKLVFNHYSVKYLSKDEDIISLTISSLTSVPFKLRSKLTFKDSA
jgi:hypothetical protein